MEWHLLAEGVDNIIYLAMLVEHLADEVISCFDPARVRNFF